MSTEKATRDSWMRIPMPEAKMRLEVDRTFSQEECECLQRGRIPQDMDDLKLYSQAFALSFQLKLLRRSPCWRFPQLSKFWQVYTNYLIVCAAIFKIAIFGNNPKYT